MDDQTFLALELLRNLPPERLKEIKLIMLGMQVQDLGACDAAVFLKRLQSSAEQKSVN